MDKLRKISVQIFALKFRLDTSDGRSISYNKVRIVKMSCRDVDSTWYWLRINPETNVGEDYNENENEQYLYQLTSERLFTQLAYTLFLIIPVNPEIYPNKCLVYGCMFCMLMFNSVSYVLLLLCLCILIVCMLCSVYSLFIVPTGILRLS